MYKFHYNIDRKLKGAEMKTKHICVGYMVTFIIRATCVSNSSTSSATITIVKMAARIKKANCVLWFQESGSAVTVQRRYHTVFERDPQTKLLIQK
jgi:hypothetical protein